MAINKNKEKESIKSALKNILLKIKDGKRDEIIGEIDEMRQVIRDIHETRVKENPKSKFKKSIDKVLGNLIEKEIKGFEEAKMFLVKLGKLKGGFGSVWSDFAGFIEKILTIENTAQKKVDELTKCLEKNIANAKEQGFDDIEKELTNMLENIKGGGSNKYLTDQISRVDKFLEGLERKLTGLEKSDQSQKSEQELIDEIENNLDRCRKNLNVVQGRDKKAILDLKQAGSLVKELDFD